MPSETSLSGPPEPEPPRQIVRACESFVKKRMAGDCTGHDWSHIERVRSLALALAKEVGANHFVVELASLLHDIDDWKLQREEGAISAAGWLRAQGVGGQVVKRITTVIGEVSFKGAGVDTTPGSVEAMVVQDADRLDAMGAIGIARAFAYGGHKGHPIYLPEVGPQPADSFEAYQKNSSHTINHFAEKLMLLKDRMNTPGARALAESRHRFMEQFLEKFHGEMRGEN